LNKVVRIQFLASTPEEARALDLSRKSKNEEERNEMTSKKEMVCNIFNREDEEREKCYFQERETPSLSLSTPLSLPEVGS